MLPRMSEAELALFASFLRSSDHYLEFGAGGSTYVAGCTVGRSVTTVDSSAQWLRDVALACGDDACRVKPLTIHADIGPTGAWGRPVDDSCRERWPSYTDLVWARPSSADADLYLVDGRFRVACFMKILLHCRADAVIAIHDFASRLQYHGIREVAREIARAEDFSAFMPIPGHRRSRIAEMALERRFDAD